MKRIFAYLLPVLVLSFALCGCGRDQSNDSANSTPTVTPMITLAPSPSIMPDMNDGEVTDKDGIIEEDKKDNNSDSSSQNSNSSSNNSSSNTSSPTPSATTNP